MINLYRIYALDRQKGWISYTILYNEEEIQETIDMIDCDKYARIFVVGHDFQNNCDVPMFSEQLKKQIKLEKKKY